jgi:hypothetical protein
MRRPFSSVLVIGVLGGACSNGAGSAAVTSSRSSTSGAGETSGSATGTSGGSGTISSGSAGASGAGTGVSTGGTQETSGTGAGDATASVGGGDASAELEASSPEAGHGPIMSSGCGIAPPANVMLGKWTDMADPGNGNPPPIMANGVARGYWALVPANYDNTKSYKVIYQGAGCGASYPNGGGESNLSGMTNSNQPVWPFQNVDMGQAIQIGVDYGFTAARPNCFDDQNPQSNDFMFFPILKKLVESEFCIDTTNVFLSGYSTGSWWVNQMTCGFGNEIRGTTEATGGEPPQPPCVTGSHIAGLFLHDVNDQLNSYAGILPAVLRNLNNNGCTTTGGGQYTLMDVQRALPSNNPATTMPWAIPQGLTIPGNGQCVQFDGCPTNSPVVFCTTTNADVQGQNHYEFVNSFIAPLFWNLLSQF